MDNRHFSHADNLLINFDQALRTLIGKPLTSGRDNPADEQPELELSNADKQHVASLMRINHTGEVCAQGLYQGQALTARDEATKQSMETSALEENDHLSWCESRLKELDDRTSLLNPLFYAGSFTIGAIAGSIGDKWSLGFVAETEKQVEEHLTNHLKQIPPEDQKSTAILEQMRTDEIHHGEKARQHGGADLPNPIKKAMSLTSKIMTKAVYRI